MNRLYEKYPYIRDVEISILEKKTVDNYEYVRIDKTICLFNNDYIKNDECSIGNSNIIGIKNIDNKLFYKLDNFIEQTDKPIKMNLNWIKRYDIMQQISSQYIFSDYLKRIYLFNTYNYYVNEEKSYIDTDINYSELNNYISIFKNIIKLCNDYIDSSLNIKSDKLLMVSNSSEIRSLEIDNFENIENKLRIHLLSGNRLINKYRKSYYKYRLKKES